MAVADLRADPGSRRCGGSCEPPLPDRRPESGWILPLPATPRIQAHGYATARPDPTHRAALAGLRLLSRACRTGSPGLEVESQTRSAPDAHRQLVVCAAAEIHFHHHLPAWSSHLSQLSRGF